MKKYKIYQTILVLILIVCFLMPHTQLYSFECGGNQNMPVDIHDLPQQMLFWISPFLDTYSFELLSFNYHVRSGAIRRFAAFKKCMYYAVHDFYKYSYERDHSGLLQYFDVSILFKTPSSIERSICWIYAKDGKK